MPARIYRPAPNAMQSGRGKSKDWVLVHEPATAREIIDQVAIKHGVSRDDIASRSRRAGVVDARSEACWRIRNEVLVNGRQISLPEIARFMGGRDHTTILHGIRKFEAELAAGKGA